VRKGDEAFSEYRQYVDKVIGQGYARFPG